MASYKFNPGFLSDDEAIAGFVVRQAELGVVINALSADDSDDAPRIIAVAPRGAGKTTLCRRVLAEVRRDLFLGSRWHPVMLGEESYSVTTPGEFLLECILHLAGEEGSAISRDDHASAIRFSDESGLINFCLHKLKTAAKLTGRRFLVIVENLHMILNDQVSGRGESLLDLLSDPSLFGVLATSVASGFDGELPGFVTLPLKPLDLEECHELWSALTKQDVPLSKIRPLQILTGGSPRLLHILAEFMKTPSLHDLLEHMNKLIDQNTEYFKSQLDALPGLERKVFVSLLEAWDPASAKQVSEAARVSVNASSSMLNRLADRGAVIKRTVGGRTVLYYAAERLFNIYYLMRRRSHPSSRVKALVAFMTQYYDREELVDTTAMLALEACQIAPERRADYHTAFNEILRGQPEHVQTEILKRTPKDFLDSRKAGVRKSTEADRPSRRSASRLVDRPVQRLIKQANALFDRGERDEAQEVLRRAEASSPTSAASWTDIALLAMRFGADEQAAQAAQQSIAREPNDSLARFVLAASLQRLGKIGDAARNLVIAVELDPNWTAPLLMLADIRADEERNEEAIALYTRAAGIEELPDETVARFGEVLWASGASGEAERRLSEAVRRRPNRASLRTLVQLLLDDGRGSEGEELLRRESEADGDGHVWTLYASYLLGPRSAPERAAAACEEALRLQVNDPQLYWLLARARARTGASENALADIAHRLEEAEEPSVLPMTIAGHIFEMARRPEPAEIAFRRAAKLSPEDPVPLLSLGRLLAGQRSRLEDAEDVFRRAQTLGPSCGPLKELAELRVHRGDDREAVALLDQALALNGSCYCALTLRAEIAVREGDRAFASQLLQKALEIVPQGVGALTTLAGISDEPTAELLVERAMASSPSHPRSLLAHARLSSQGGDRRLKDLREALALDSNLAEANLELSRAHLEIGELREAIVHLESALQTIPARMEIIPSFVETALVFARNGYARDVARILAGDRGRCVEPLYVALQIHLGDQPLVASEILDVAGDILLQLNSSACPFRENGNPQDEQRA